MATTKFLSYAGLQKLWALISDKFATKADALKSVEFTANTTGVNVGYTKVDGTTSSAAVPVASSTQAGIITAATFDKIEAVAGNIEAAVTVKDVKIGTSSILHDKVASFALEYEVDSEKNEAYISLVDAGVDKGTEGRALSRIDVSALVKTGLLAGVDLVVNPTGQATGTFIKMTFNTVNGTQDTYINVTDLIDIYSAGTGIEVVDGDVDGDNGAATAKTINLKAAGDGTLGGIKLGYAENGKNYPVEVDENGKAFVNVPWINISAGMTGDDYINASGSIDETGNGAFTVAATDKLKTAVAKAESAIQGVTINENDLITATATSGGNIALDVTKDLTDAVAAAGTALQGATAGTGVDVTVAEKIVTVGLNSTTVTSLGKADSALQSVEVLGTTLTKDSPAISVEQAKTALGLKSAAYKDAAATIEDGDKLVTAGVVKTYVDNINTTLSGSIAELERDLDDAKTALNAKDAELDGRLATVENYVGVPEAEGREATGIFKTILDNEKTTAHALNDLDGRVTANATAIANVSNEAKSYTDNAIGQLDASFTGTTTFMTGLTQVDGKITEIVTRQMVVADISDFAALTDAEIEGICK